MLGIPVPGAAASLFGVKLLDREDDITTNEVAALRAILEVLARARPGN